MRTFSALLLAALCGAPLFAAGCGGGDDDDDDDDGTQPSAGTGTGAISGGGAAGATGAGAPGSGTGGRVSAAGARTGGAATGGSSTAGVSSGGTGGGTPCTTDEVVCDDAETVRVCADGLYETATCTEVCAELAFEPGGCDMGCDCGEPLSPDCAVAAEAACVCYEAAGGTCSNLEFFQAYLNCVDQAEGYEAILCYADYVTGTMIDCASADAACLATP